MRFLLLLIVLGLAGCVIFYGCNGVDKNTQQQVSQGAQNVLENGKKSAVRIGHELQQTGGQMEETLKVKGPIDASKDIDSSRLSVTTIGKKIIVDGTVPTQDQREKVEKMIDANKDNDYTVEDNLKVAPDPDGQKNDSGASNTNPPITDNQNR